MVTSRSVPQQTAQILSAFAGQKRPGLRFWQIGQVTNDPLEVCVRTGKHPSAAEAGLVLRMLTARLKRCPDEEPKNSG